MDLYTYNIGTYTNLTKSHASLQPIHEVLHIYPQMRIKHLKPFSQVFFHGIEILLTGLEGPKRPRFQKYSRHFYFIYLLITFYLILNFKSSASSFFNSLKYFLGYFQILWNYFWFWFQKQYAAQFIHNFFKVIFS